MPVPLGESPRAVFVQPVQAELLRVGTALDLLRYDSSVFLEQRGAGGAQSDLVLRGGSFAQTLVMINGFRVNDGQSAHHNLDLPIPLDAMSSIQVLEGAGSTLHGADALSGVVDFLTTAPSQSSVRLRAGVGSFGANEESVMAEATRASLSGRLTATRNFSTGFMTDRDYRNEDASLEAWAGTQLGVTDLLVAASDRAFGANQFYGNFTSWERTKGWFAAVRQDLGSRLVAAYGYRRHTDDFILVRDNPALYANNHVDAAWQSSLRYRADTGATTLLLGLEADGDSIASNNLGIHARNRGAGYADIDIHPAKRQWKISAGVREEMFSGRLPAVWSPQLAASLRVAHAVKLRASAGYGFRIPTYTDLYYSDPSTVGNPGLKPESAWSGDGGADWAPSSRLMFAVTGFYTRQHDTIDYVRASSAERWQAANLRGLHFTGVESSLTWIPSAAQKVRVAWTGLHGAQQALNGLQSRYVFNYPVENIHATWTMAIRRDWTVSNRVQIAQRYRQTAYPVWNVSLSREAGRVRPYLRLDNLSNTGYEEISGVAMPGRSFTGGFAIRLGK
ncbi:MAG TPA: TonB-dependent receptor [Terracidiphilus sp.]|nr:TonB-dependent receptor [Terracidiphilus sp.]